MTTAPLQSSAVEAVDSTDVGIAAHPLVLGAGVLVRNARSTNVLVLADHDGVINLRCIVHPGTIDVPECIFKALTGLIVSTGLRGGTPQARICKSRRFLIALPG